MQISSVKPAVVQHMVKRACGESGEMPAETLNAYFELKKLVHVYEFKDISVESGDMECIVLPFVKAMGDMFPAIFVLIMQDAQAPLASSLEAMQRMYQLSTYHHNFTSEDLISSRVYVGIYNEQSQKLYSVETAVDMVQQSQRRKAQQAAKARQERLARQAAQAQNARNAQIAQRNAQAAARNAQVAQRNAQNFRNSGSAQPAQRQPQPAQRQPQAAQPAQRQPAQRQPQPAQRQPQAAQRQAQPTQYPAQNAQRPAQAAQRQTYPAQRQAQNTQRPAQYPAQNAQRSTQAARAAQATQSARRPAQVAYPDSSINQQFE